MHIADITIEYRMIYIPFKFSSINTTKFWKEKYPNMQKGFVKEPEKSILMNTKLLSQKNSFKFKKDYISK